LAPRDIFASDGADAFFQPNMYFPPAPPRGAAAIPLVALSSRIEKRVAAATAAASREALAEAALAPSSPARRDTWLAPAPLPASAASSSSAAAARLSSGIAAADAAFAASSAVRRAAACASPDVWSPRGITAAPAELSRMAASYSRVSLAY